VNSQKHFEYARTFKLSPALGDWTALQHRGAEYDEVNVSSVHNVNFDSLPRDKMNRIHYLHYRLAEEITKRLSEDMNINVELYSVTALQLKYGEFLNTIKDKIVQTDFGLDTFGKATCIFDWGLAEMIVNRLSGGKGEETHSETFTDMEVKILETQIQELKPILANLWKNVLPLQNIKTKWFSGYYVRDKKLALREAYSMFSFVFFFGKEEVKKMIVAYPNVVLKRLLEKQDRIQTPLKQQVSLYPETLKKIAIPVKVELGKVILKMKEMKELQVGDIVRLDSFLHFPVKIYLGKSQLLGQPGILNNTLCVQVIFMEEGKRGILAHPFFLPEEESGVKDKESADALLTGAQPVFETPVEPEEKEETLPIKEEIKENKTKELPSKEEIFEETQDFSEKEMEEPLEEPEELQEESSGEEDDFSWEDLDEEL